MGDDGASVWSEIRFDPATGLLELRLADGSVELAAAPTIEVDDVVYTAADAEPVDGLIDLGPGEEGEVTLDLAGPGLEWMLRAELSADARTVHLAAELRNHGAEAVVLGRCALLEIGPDQGWCRFAGDDGNAVVLLSSGTTGRNTVIRAATEGTHQSMALLQLVSHAAGRALHLGFTSLDRLPAWHELSYDAVQGVQTLASLCDFGGRYIEVGENLRSHTLTIEAGPDFHASLHRWADRVAERYGPRIRRDTPAGWVGWAWVDPFNVERYEDVVLRNAAAVRRRLPGHEIRYLWVSIGNLDRGLPGNWLQWDYHNFPHGPEWLVQRLRELGFELGLWCGAFWVASSLDEVVERLRPALLECDGEPAVAVPHWPYGESGKLPVDQRPAIYAVDPTHPAAAEYLDEVFTAYRAWGVRYFMVDFLNAVSWPMPGGLAYDEPHDERASPGPAVLRHGLAVIRQAAGNETYLLSSSGPTFWNVGFVDACRVGNDYGEGRALNPESYFYPATFVINGAEFWTSHRYASDNMAGSYFTHRKLYLNDSGNVMTVDKPIPLGDAQITATIFGLCGGPVMLGDDVNRLAEERLALLRKVFPRTPEMAVPVDLFDSPAPDYPKVFHLHVDAGWDAYGLVGLLNYGDEALTRELRAEQFGLDPAAELVVWEFWNEQYLGRVTGGWRAVVPPRSARLYRVAVAREHPWVLSTDLHVQQGRVELSEVAWNARKKTLSGLASRPSGETGSLFLTVPKGLRVETPRGLWIAKDARDESLIIRVALRFDEGPVAWTVRFAPLAEGH